jgi:NADH dehydrogenase FAD-containing subunit
MSRKKLLLAGGGHAHMMTLENLHRFRDKGYEVTVVQPSPHHYYSGMGPGMLGNTYSPAEIRFDTRHVVEKQGGTFILGKVARIDPEGRQVFLESGESYPYDVLSLNIGSSVPRKIITTDVAENIFTVKPIERLQQARQLILKLGAEKPITVAVIGGGPSGVEIAGNVWGLAHRSGLRPVKIHIFARTSIMTGFPDGIRHRAIESLKARGIDIVEHSPVKAINTNQVELESLQTYDVDVIFVAIGVNPSPVIRESGLSTGPEGGLLVNKYLQSVDHPEIFGGGDCIYFKDQPLDKVGVYAVRENPVLLNNLMASLDGVELQPFDPGGDYLLIFNLGDNTGIFRKKCLLFGGRLAFFIKDYIDKKFMKKYQADS